MAAWLENLTPEFYITLGLFLVLLILIIIVLIKIIQTNRRVGTQDFDLLESISKEENIYTYHITLVNKSFSSNQIDVIGLTKGNVRHILKQEHFQIAPRSKVTSDILMSEVEAIILEDKFKRVYLFAENEIGLRNTDKCKKLNKFLKRRVKEIKKEKKLALKKERFETGNYNAWERIVLFIKLLFRPFYKLHQKIKHKTNITLKESEVRRIQKAEHDQIKYKLEATVARSNEIKVREEAFKENKTRETELELLKQEKVLEIEALKQKTILEEFEKKRKEIESIDPKEEVKKYLEENPITYDDIYKVEEIAQESEEIDELNELEGVDSMLDPEEAYLEETEDLEENNDKKNKKRKKKEK